MKTVTHRKSDTNAKPFITSKFSSKAMASRWQRAITTLDGVWLTCGKFSQNCTFTIRNYIYNSWVLLYFVHACMRGKESDTVSGEFYQGTSKGTEGYTANVVFQGAKEEGMHIKVQCQDGDSCAEKTFREHFMDIAINKICQMMMTIDFA